MHDLPISKIMSTSLVTAGPDDALRDAAALLDARRVHHLLVVDHGRLVGILSSADLLKSALLERPDEMQMPHGVLHLRVRDVMQRGVVKLRENASLRDAAYALSLGGYHALPVLALDDTPVGIVTSTDLVALLLEQIERDAPRSPSVPQTTPVPQDGAMPRLLEVLRAADVYLHSGQSDQQHARLTRAVARAREVTRSPDSPLRI